MQEITTPYHIDTWLQNNGNTLFMGRYFCNHFVGSYLKKQFSANYRVKRNFLNWAAPFEVHIHALLETLSSCVELKTPVYWLKDSFGYWRKWIGCYFDNWLIILSRFFKTKWQKFCGSSFLSVSIFWFLSSSMTVNWISLDCWFWTVGQDGFGRNGEWWFSPFSDIL